VSGAVCGDVCLTCYWARGAPNKGERYEKSLKPEPKGAAKLVSQEPIYRTKNRRRNERGGKGMGLKALKSPISQEGDRANGRSKKAKTFEISDAEGAQRGTPTEYSGPILKSKSLKEIAWKGHDSARQVDYHTASLWSKQGFDILNLGSPKAWLDEASSSRMRIFSRGREGIAAESEARSSRVFIYQPPTNPKRKVRIVHRSRSLR